MDSPYVWEDVRGAVGLRQPSAHKMSWMTIGRQPPAKAAKGYKCWKNDKVQKNATGTIQLANVLFML